MTRTDPPCAHRPSDAGILYTPRSDSGFPASRDSTATSAAPAGRSRVARSALRVLRGGSGSLLADIELLQVLLGPGKSGNCGTLAREVLEAGLFADPTRPIATSDWWNRLGPARASRLLAALELARRSGGEGGRLEPALRSPGEVYEVTADLRPHRREHFVGLYLNSRNRLLARETVSVGSLNASIVHPREVYEPALRHGAASLVVVHNHPSGETDPSEDDLSITRRLSEAGDILGIALLDHVIVGRRGYTSLKELGHL